MLELKNISLSVEDEFTNNAQKEILRDINLTVETGKFIVITGPNGGGKSTMAKMIAGILQPDHGQILLDGEDITGLNITERAQKGISFAFQQPIRFKGITVRDLIELAAGHPIDDSEACSYLRRVGLCARDYIDREVNASLSGGEIKRIEIATVMARKTKLSIFDEPEAGIDLWSFNNLIDVFRSMRQKTTVLSSSSPTRSGFWTLLTKSSCWPMAASPIAAARRRFSPSCCTRTAVSASVEKVKRISSREQEGHA